MKKILLIFSIFINLTCSANRDPEMEWVYVHLVASSHQGSLSSIKVAGKESITHLELELEGRIYNIPVEVLGEFVKYPDYSSIKLTTNSVELKYGEAFWNGTEMFKSFLKISKIEDKIEIVVFEVHAKENVKASWSRRLLYSSDLL